MKKKLSSAIARYQDAASRVAGESRPKLCLVLKKVAPETSSERFLASCSPAKCTAPGSLGRAAPHADPPECELT